MRGETQGGHRYKSGEERIKQKKKVRYLSERGHNARYFQHKGTKKLTISKKPPLPFRKHNQNTTTPISPRHGKLDKKGKRAPKTRKNGTIKK